MHKIDPDIRARLSGARLPAMPQILLELMERCQADDAAMAQLAELVAKDAALTAKILGVANSSAYPHRQQHLSLEQSLIMLGTDTVKTLLISESVFQIFDNFSQSSSTDLRGFWKHALGAAIVARMIAVKIGYPHIEEAYLAGLLHDVGRLALLAIAPKEYALNFLARDDDNLCAVEQRTLQMTHTEAGAWLIERWNLDSFLADSVLYHHEPAVRIEKAPILVRIVYIAHQVTSPETDDATLETVGALCGLTGDDVTLIRDRAADQVRKSADYLGIDLTGADKPAPAAFAPLSAGDPAKERLADKMRSMFLASEAGRTFAKQQGAPQLLESIARSARLLFDFQDAVIFQMDEAGRALAGAQSGSHRQRLAELAIPLNGGSTIASAALQRRIAFIGADRNPLGLAEEQLLRLLNAECLVCLPLVVADRCEAVVIGAAGAWQLPDLHRREGFLYAFGAQAGAALKAVAAQAHDAPQASTVAAGIEEKYREASRRVAHEVNNPLSIIKNYLSVLDRKLSRQEPVNGEMSILNEEIDRVGQIINGLAEPQPGAHLMAQHGATQVDRVANDVVRLFRDTEYVSPSVKINLRMQDRPTEIDGDGDTLKQILVNLVKNAVEALADGGKIEICNNGIVNHDGRPYVELLVSDTGPGMTADVMGRLFSPLRSSKDGAHRGLGLSIVHGLVKKMQGLITCRSSSQGTTFEILLPVPRHPDHSPAARSQASDSA